MIDKSGRSGGIMRIYSIFYNMKVCYVFSLESHGGDSNEYTQQTIFNTKKKEKLPLIILSLPL